MKRLGMLYLMLVLSLLLPPIGVMAQSKDKPTYLFGADESFPPWSWMENGKLKGFDWELVQYIGKEGGFNIKPAFIPWPTVLTSVEKGDIDICGAGLSFTCKRAKVLGYSLPYWKISYWALVQRDSTLNGVTALSRGARVGSLTNGTGHMWLQEELVDRGVDIKLIGYGFEHSGLGIRDLEQGKIDSYFIDSPFCRKILSEGYNVKAVGKGYAFDLIAFAVPHSDPHNLTHKINEGIKKAYESGKWAELVQKYMPWGPIEQVPYDIDYSKYCKE